MLSISVATVNDFRTNGFVRLESPLTQAELHDLRAAYLLADQAYQSRTWPKDAHPLAMRFALMGEQVFELAERVDFLEAAKQLLRVEDVFIGCCGIGNAVEMVMSDGRPRREIEWHSTPGPETIDNDGIRQVAFRFALDDHNGETGRLKLLPGTHCLAKSAIQANMAKSLIADRERLVWNSRYFGNCPGQVELSLTDEDMLVWTPDVWHATGEMQVECQRRAITWIYFPPGGRFRDRTSLIQMFPDEIGAWNSTRRTLWGIPDVES